jgi:hypothetical protein
MRATLALVVAALLAPCVTQAQTTRVTSSSPPEAKLVAIDRGTSVVATSEIRDYGTLLDSLARKCPEGRSFIGDIAVRATQLLEERRVPFSVKRMLVAMDEAIPREAAKQVKCTEVASALVVMISGGDS